MPERFLSVENASVGYGKAGARTHALRDVSLSLEQSKLTLVTGPSGSGKTTLLSLLGCLLRPDTGAVYLAGQEMAGQNEPARTAFRRRYIGFVFQAFRLLRSLSAADNVAIANDVAGRTGGRRRAAELLAHFGLAGKAHLKPDELSGGEKQRVAIARALIGDPAIVLADEPTASLDSHAGQQISEILVRLAREQNRTVVVVSHDPRWRQFAQRVVVLRDGRISEDGSTNA